MPKRVVPSEDNYKTAKEFLEWADSTLAHSFELAQKGKLEEAQVFTEISRTAALIANVYTSLPRTV